MKVLLSWLALVIVVAAVGGWFVWSGVYNIAAAKPHKTCCAAISWVERLMRCRGAL